MFQFIITEYVPSIRYTKKLTSQMFINLHASVIIMQNVLRKLMLLKMFSLNAYTFFNLLHGKSEVFALRGDFFSFSLSPHLFSVY